MVGRELNVLAMYLPQFHRIPENDAWWGEGFTEWVAVKKAKPLFEGHYQPRIPHDRFYYNLLEKTTMQWQADLMHRYGIDGMCIYHYWFKDGRQILEKPMENLLEWKDIDMPFCICWANETWARSWSKLSSEKNTWADTFEPEHKNEEDDKGVLLLQDYGDRNEWENHFRYLIPFFKDNRYIKKDGKPVFVIHRTGDISCLEAMLSCFRELALEEGLPGLYIIGGECRRDMGSIIDGELILEPQAAFKRMDIDRMGGTGKADYNIVWGKVLSREHLFSTQPYFGGFTGYDDTPRRGIEGTVIENTDPFIFKDNLIKLINKNISYGSEFVFINAWNEWGEGMYLEPDEKWGDAFLKAVRNAKACCRDNPIDKSWNIGESIEENATLYNKLDRVNSNLLLLDKWLFLHEQGISFSRYIDSIINGDIFIYGYGILGKHLVNELEYGKIKIKGIIERDRSKVHIDVPVSEPDTARSKVDAVIVTAIYDYEEIKDLMKKLGAGEVYSLEDLIISCLRENGY